MAERSLDDDAPSRIRAADERIYQGMAPDLNQESADSDNTPDAQPGDAALLDSADQLAEVRDIRRNLGRIERDLIRARSVARVRGTALMIAGLTLLAGVGWTVWTWQTPSRFLGPDIFCGVLIGLCIGGAVADARWRSPADSRAVLEDRIEIGREAVRIVNALRQPPLNERRSLYREDVAGVIEQHRADSRKYRLVHNALQNLIMTGSAATTTVAALDTGGKLTWQNVTIVAIGFAVTLAAAFTGYYKYRERSYFLLQTADAIEEEANAKPAAEGEG
ncbi:SLATT domain-containing protein [Streptomyces aquilus]|uniref:SLATT domain-containing protein n=1 Tax=Streptomyces aquilus TaxID=2548456 RepID=A0A3Q9C7P2_9ACTN|nr:SLATT domain-containing protein [Streptomyces aquilus]AZP22776.1 SLATT domain-containing protein [Streptomyces aquilus]